MERKLRYAWWFVLVALVVIAIWKLFLPHGSNAYLQKTTTSREIVVYVSGAVERPGLVHLAADARLDDALQQVRLLPEANLESLNPAEKLKDGQKINVPYKPQSVLEAAGGVDGGNSSGSASGIAAGSAGAEAAANLAVSTGVRADGKININTAGAEELTKLNGIGPALAQRIIQYRTERGPFSKPEDLKKVSGIGDKTFEKMASQVTVGP